MLTRDSLDALMGRLPGGLRVIEDHSVPAFQPILQLSPDLGDWCTPEFRDRTNNWLLKRFGTEMMAYCIGDAVLVAPIVYRSLFP